MPRSLNSSERDFIEKLFRENKENLTSTIRFMLGQKYVSHADDCLSNVFCKACENIDILLKHENPTGWLVMTARNLTHCYVKKETTIDKHSSPDKGNEIENIPDETDDYENLIEGLVYDKWLDGKAVDIVLSLVSPKEKLYLDLYYIAKLSYEEISRRTGKSAQAVRGVIVRTRKRIIKYIKHHGFENIQ